MKRLNKKGFTLVELLAVIVIIALLMVVIANTALPALNNTKKRTLETYAKRVVEQAKTIYTTDCVMATDAAKCAATHPWTLIEIMGADADTTQYELVEFKIEKDTDGTLKVSGSVKDIKNNITVAVADSKVGTAA